MREKEQPSKMRKLIGVPGGESQTVRQVVILPPDEEGKRFVAVTKILDFANMTPQEIVDSSYEDCPLVACIDGKIIWHNGSDMEEAGVTRRQVDTDIRFLLELEK